MATRYRRIDLELQVRRSPDGSAAILGTGVDAEGRLPIADLDRGDWASVLVLLGEIGFRRRLAAWRERCATAATDPSVRVVPRLALLLDDVRLAAVPWETLLEGLLEVGECIARVSPVLPRARSIPLALPLRLLHVDPEEARPLDDGVRAAFDIREREGLDSVVRTDARPVRELESLRGDWPTADVVYFERTAWPLDDKESLLSTADPERPHTLGWLARLTERWQTRLLVLRDPGLWPWDWPHRGGRSHLSELATALVGRGGPAVLVVPWWEDDSRVTEAVAALFRDEPLDATHARNRGWWGRRSALHVGAGREEGLRISRLGAIQDHLKLASAVRRRRDEDAFESFEEVIDEDEAAAPGVDDELYELALGPPPDALDEALSEVVTRAERFEPERPEQLVSFGKSLAKLRDQVQPGARRAALEGMAPETLDPRRTSGEERRYTSASLHEAGDDGALVFVDPRDGRLRAGRVYHLEVQIGPGRRPVPVVGALDLLDEVIKLSPEEHGAWLEVAVTGLDFDVIGDPVQELWLPRKGSSEPLYFAVRPRAPGAARLRVCLYFRNAVVQSLRLAALVLAEGEPDVAPQLRRRALAAAVDAQPDDERLRDAGYLLRAEYGGVTGFEAIRRRPKRALSIVANDWEGRYVLSVKSAGRFDVRIDENLPDYVTNVRSTIDDLSTICLNPDDLDAPPAYRFGEENRGSEADLRDALQRLAQYGFQIFAALVPSHDRERIARLLDGSGRTIEAAHVVRDKVVPWAVVYDREFDPERGEPTVCLAPLQGRPRPERCSDAPSCVLRRAGAPDARTVVCPLHFWGFQHRIELPQRQTQAMDGIIGQDGPPARNGVSGGRPASVFVGRNASLPLAERHLATLKQAEPSVARVDSRDERNPILDCLQNPLLDVIYFYCHARREGPKGSFDPALLVQAIGRSEGTITARALSSGMRWENAPLVFLNACSTGGFSPKALSPFLQALVDDRGAGGVITTEVKVWEPLAAEFGELFLASFLRGETAADALLEARWALLHRHNPLGLVYTLYASADLQLPPVPSVAGGNGSGANG